MDVIPLAHAGHWYHAILYLAPVLLVVVALWLSSLRERRAERDGEREPKR
jgi:cytochrome c-type biogenesis protein CcmH/NrfF